MKTLFWLFENYAAARTATARLQDRGFDAEEMNAIALEEVVKEAVDVDWQAVEVKVSDEVGEQALEGLDRLLGGERPVEGPDVGDVFATGTMATLLAKTALHFGGGSAGFEDALVDLNVPQDVAGRFVRGIKERGVLFWLRCEDARASEASGALQDQQGAIQARYVHP